MASDYGLNFGFRVSDETRRSSMGRVKTPATGANLLLGTAVEIDPVTPGFLRKAGNGALPRTGVCGLLVQEEVWNRSIYQSNLLDSFSLGTAALNTLSVITNGPGTKIWLKNTVGSTRADGRVIPTVTMFTPGTGATAVKVGQGLAWDGTYWVNVTDPTDKTSFMEVVYYDSARGYLEAILSH